MRLLILVPLVLLLLLHAALAGKDPYSVLGLTKSATEREIKRAYRNLALKHHPDKSGSKPANKKRFLEIQEAYDILSDPEKKQRHDLGGYEQSESGYQQQWSNHGSWRYDWEEASHSQDIPSVTTRLTTSNMATNVLFSHEPWLVLVYAEDNPACRTFATTWEALHKLVGGGSDETPWVRMGRINWRSQRTLAFWVANNRMSSNGFTWDLLPTVFGVRPECRQSECFIRYRGAMTMSGLNDFIADQLLKWRPIPAVQLNNLDVFLRRAHPAKVIALAFSKSTGQGSLSLRHVAEVQENMMQFARVSLAGSTETAAGAGGVEEAAAAWEKRLGVTGIKSPCLVLLRGPGTVPQVVPVKAGTLEATIAEKTLMWQTIPALRPDTINPLGCRWGGAGGDDYFYSDYIAGAKLCVVVISHDQQLLTQARQNMLHLHDLLLSHEAGKNPSLSSAAAAFKSGQIRLTWLDAAVQTQFCRSHLKDYDVQVQQAVCGWKFLDGLVGLVTEFSLTSLIRVFNRQPPQTVLLAFKPSTPGSSSTTHMFSILRSQHIARDMSRAESANELHVIGAWIDQTLKTAGTAGKPRRGGGAEPLQVLTGRDVPRMLVTDDDPQALDFLIDRGVEIARHVMRFLISCFSPQDWSPELQTICAAVCTCLILLVTQMVLQGNGQQAPREHDEDEEVEQLLRRHSEAGEADSEWEEMLAEGHSNGEQGVDDGGLGRASARSAARGEADARHSDRQRQD